MPSDCSCVRKPGKFCQFEMYPYQANFMVCQLILTEHCLYIWTWFQWVVLKLSWTITSTIPKQLLGMYLSSNRSVTEGNTFSGWCTCTWSVLGKETIGTNQTVMSRAESMDSSYIGINAIYFASGRNTIIFSSHKSHKQYHSVFK